MEASITRRAGPRPTVDARTFERRLKTLYSSWRDNKVELWRSATAFAVATPPPSDLRYLKSSALCIWLLGSHFSDTIIVFLDNQIHMLCSKGKASYFEVLKKSAKDAVNVDLVVHVIAENEDGSTQIDKILSAVESKENPILGCISGDAHEGKLLKSWTSKLESSGIKHLNVKNGLAYLFAAKDIEEIQNVKKAASLAVSAMEVFVVPKLAKVINEESTITHASLTVETRESILKPSSLNVHLKAENVGTSYTPVFQSGGNFDLGPRAKSNDDSLYYGSASVIICALGTRYKNYCANVARTFLIEPDATQTKAYEVLLKAHEAAICSLKDGNQVKDVYRAAYSVVEKEAPELISNLTKSAGAGMGILLRDTWLSLNDENETILKEGMVLNVSLGFNNLQAKSSKAKNQKYALLLADTVIVTEKGQEVVTSSSTKSFKDVKDLKGQHQAELMRQRDKEIAQRLAAEEQTIQQQAELARQKKRQKKKETEHADDEDEWERDASNADEGERKRKLKALGKSRADSSSSAPKRLKF